jgi:ABC-type transporter Mla subunit MlaD
MALQDLTPQLRTRLSRMERAVGWFVIIAVFAMAFGFFYYLYATAEHKGWFLTKAHYFTFVDSASGLKVGDPVMLMGSEAGRITKIEPMPAYQFVYNVCVKFEVKSPNYGYLWTEGSRARLTSGLLGNRALEITKGTGGYPTYISHPLREVTLEEAAAMPDLAKWQLAEEVVDAKTRQIAGQAMRPVTNLPALAAAGRNRIWILNPNEERKPLTGNWNPKTHRYDVYTNGVTQPYWLVVDEAPEVMERVNKLVAQIEQALPNILALTNQLALVLSNTASLTADLNAVALQARPAVSNLAAATAHLDQPGALGEWLLPTNLNQRLDATLLQADSALAGANSNLTSLVGNLNRSLDNLAGITSNLNRQVDANTNLVTAVSDTIQHADQFLQGLKRHWLLRSAFRAPKTNAPPAKRLESPKAKGS